MWFVIVTNGETPSMMKEVSRKSETGIPYRREVCSRPPRLFGVSAEGLSAKLGGVQERRQCKDKREGTTERQ
jgi:hypothetical protein